MRREILILLILFFTTIALSQNPPDTLWTKIYDYSQYDQARYVQQTLDNGFIIAGSTLEAGHDFWIIKTDNNGNEEWNQTYGGYGNQFAESILQLSDGKYIIAGTSWIPDAQGVESNHILIIKTDNNGNLEWSNLYGNNDDEIGVSIQQTNDGGFIICSYIYITYFNYDYWLIKIDMDGNIEWTQTYGNWQRDRAYSVQQTLDGGYIIAGMTEANGDDFWIIKTDNNGNVEWDQTYGGSSSESAISIQQSIDGGYIIFGETWSFGSGFTDWWIVKIDSLGNEEWNQVYGGSGYDLPKSFQQTSDDGYIFLGQTYLYGPSGFDIWIVKTDLVGNELWTLTLGDTEDERAYSIQQTIHDNYIITGNIGTFQDNDVFLIMLNSDVNSIDQNLLYNCNKEFTSSNYPNPFNPTTTISFSIPEESKVELIINNIKGQKIRSLLNDQISAGEHSIIWNGEDDSGKKVSSGVYLYKLTVDDKIEAVKKCLLLK